MNVLNSFDNIIKNIKQTTGNYKIDKPVFNTIKSDVDELSGTFVLSSSQLILLAVIIDMCGYESISIEKISDALGCNFFELLKLKRDLDVLKSRDYIEGSDKISVSSDLLDSLEKNMPYQVPMVSDLSTKSIVEKLKGMIKLVKDKRKCPSSLLKLTDRMILANPSTSLAMVCDRYSILSYSSLPMEYLENEEYAYTTTQNECYTDSVSPQERMLFYISLCNSEDTISWNDIRFFFKPYEIRTLYHAYLEDSLDLQKNGVVEYVCKDDFKFNSSVKSQAMADMLAEKSSEKKYDELYPSIQRFSQIKIRNLYFNPETKKQIVTLGTLLLSDKFLEVRDSLLKCGLRTGFTVLFHGGPGTGKTESVYQLAKMTGHDIIRVEVSELKNQYVGESEKNVQEVFDKYKKYVKASGKFPILLFNEADSIFGVRPNGASKAVEKMENSIQNIILQQMEELDGILIATTNLIGNLDRAFDRRFLYKVYFPMPDNVTRSDIWMSMVPEISRADADLLASEFKLSGGQIENVCRKRLIHSVLSKEQINITTLRQWCSDEFLAKSSKIGYVLE